MAIVNCAWRERERIEGGRERAVDGCRCEVEASQVAKNAGALQEEEEGVEMVFPSLPFNTIINQMISPNALLTN